MKLSTAAVIIAATASNVSSPNVVLAGKTGKLSPKTTKAKAVKAHPSLSYGSGSYSMSIGPPPETTPGVAVPLGYVQLSERFGNAQQLTVRLRLPGADRDQNVFIDTGSSSLVFCDKSLIDEAENISTTNYGQCKTYGGASYQTCPDGSIGSRLGFAGQVFRGDVSAYNDKGDEVVSMDNVTFSTMDFEQMSFCGPLDGIFGLAYKGMNVAAELPSPEFDVSSLWDVSCPNPNQTDFSLGYETFGLCNYDDMPMVVLTPPLVQAFQQDYNSGEITEAAFGIYLDYAATTGSEVDTIVQSLGTFFYGDVAYDNNYYNNGEVQVTDIYSCKGVLDWYMLYFTSIRVPGFNLTQSTVDLCTSECGQCYTDTGTSMIILPLDDYYCYMLYSSTDDELKELGSLFIDLPGADGKDITLSFPLLWLAEQIALGHVLCTGTTGRLVLGLPIRQYYYTVYDMGNKTVSFVELNLSNATKAFIDGPELGGLYPPKNEEPDNEEEAADGTTAPQPTPQPTSMGGAAADGDNTTTISPTPQPTSMGCFHHTNSLSFLAWTVFVPYAAALIASL